MKCYFLILLFLCSLQGIAQSVPYTTANAHSHNDYRNPDPFWTAYQHGFGSIEADIYLYRDELIVAHDTQELKLHRTLEQYYIQPVLMCIQNNNGHVYPDSSKQLQLMIDIKSDSATTLNKLINLIQKYPALIHTRSLHWVISGNRPPPDAFSSYPFFIWFDGELRKTYTDKALSRIAMLSDNFAHYSTWKGSGDIPVNEMVLLRSAIKHAQDHKKPVRFWNTPDTEHAWKQFIDLKVDFINTDHIATLTTYLMRISASTGK